MEDLFTKYGGMPFWAEFIDHFYEKATTDSALREFFANKDMKKIKEMQLSLVEMTITGNHFPEGVITEAHRNLTVTDTLFRQFLSLYESSLIHEGVETEDAAYIVEILLGYKKQVVFE